MATMARFYFEGRNRVFVVLSAAAALRALFQPAVGGARRQIDGERRAHAWLASQRHRAAGFADDAAGDPEAEAEAGVAAVGDGALEALEHARLMVRRNADPVVGHLEARAAAVRRHDDLDRAALAVLHGVRDEVRDDLIEAHPIPHSGRRIQPGGDLRPLLRLEAIDDLADH